MPNYTPTSPTMARISTNQYITQNGEKVVAIAVTDLKNHIRQNVDELHGADHQVLFGKFVQLLRSTYDPIDDRNTNLPLAELSLIVRTTNHIDSDGAVISFTQLLNFHHECGCLLSGERVQEYACTFKNRIFGIFLNDIHDLVEQIFNGELSLSTEVHFAFPYTLNGQGSDDRFGQTCRFLIEGILIEPAKRALQ